MRKSFAVILLAFILMTPLLASCATTADTDAPSSPPADQSPSPTAEVPPSEDIEATASAPVEILEPSRDPSHAPAQMNAYVLTFGGAEDEFFSAYENTDRALDALEPLLFPAVWAALDAEGLFHVEDDPADARFKWTTVYHMIKDYTSEKTGLTQSDGNFIVHSRQYGRFLPRGVRAIRGAGHSAGAFRTDLLRCPERRLYAQGRGRRRHDIRAEIHRAEPVEQRRRRFAFGEPSVRRPI
jgi:hypothetical protein